MLIVTCSRVMFQTDELSCSKVVPPDQGSSIDVTLRCTLSIEGEDVPFKAIGFIKPDEFRAHLFLMHEGCDTCERVLDRARALLTKWPTPQVFSLNP